MDTTSHIVIGLGLGALAQIDPEVAKYKKILRKLEGNCITKTKRSEKKLKHVSA